MQDAAAWLVGALVGALVGLAIFLAIYLYLKRSRDEKRRALREVRRQRTADPAPASMNPLDASPSRAIQMRADEDVGDDVRTRDFREKLIRIFTVYDPMRLGEVDELVLVQVSNADEVIADMIEKYGPVPSEEEYVHANRALHSESPASAREQSPSTQEFSPAERDRAAPVSEDNVGKGSLAAAFARIGGSCRGSNKASKGLSKGDENGHGITDSEALFARRKLELIVKNDSGEMNMEQFVKFMTEVVGSQMSQSQLEEIFKTLDADKRGIVTLDEVLGAFKVIAQIEHGKKDPPDPELQAKLKKKGEEIAEQRKRDNNNARVRGAIVKACERVAIMPDADVEDDCCLSDLEKDQIVEGLAALLGSGKGEMNMEQFVKFMKEVVGSQMSQSQLEDIFRTLNPDKHRTLSIGEFVSAFRVIAQIEHSQKIPEWLREKLEKKGREIARQRIVSISQRTSRQMFATATRRIADEVKAGKASDSDHKSGLNEQEFKALREQFSLADTHGKGELTKIYFVKFMKEAVGSQLSRSKLWKIFRMLDSEKKGYVALTEVVGSFKVLAQIEHGTASPQELEKRLAVIAREIAGPRHRLAETAARTTLANASQRLAEECVADPFLENDFAQNGFTDQELDLLLSQMDRLDVEFAEEMSFEPFVQLMTNVMGSTMPREQLQKIFTALDTDSRGMIKFGEFVAIYKFVAMIEHARTVVSEQKLLEKAAAWIAEQRKDDFVIRDVGEAQKQARAMFTRVRERMAAMEIPEDNDPDHGFTDEELKALQAHFRLYDKKATGEMDVDVFVDFIKNVIGSSLVRSQVEDLFARMDPASHGAVTFEALLFTFKHISHIEKGDFVALEAVNKRVNRVAKICAASSPPHRKPSVSPRVSPQPSGAARRLSLPTVSSILRSASPSREPREFSASPRTHSMAGFHSAVRAAQALARAQSHLFRDRRMAAGKRSWKF